MINLGNATSSELSKALQVNDEKLSRWARLERSNNALEVSSFSVKSSNKSKKKRMS
jgi:hypothetical protein